MNYDQIMIEYSLVFRRIFQIFLLVGYSRRTSNYPKRIALFNPTHRMSDADLVIIGVEKSMIHSGCFFGERVY